jgi:asparagine synthase (glutamine-hydrolysing)
MCGIIAINGNNVKEYLSDQLLSSISHRGPDDRGEFISKNADVYFGQTRLSIIDLSDAGHQPMRDGSGRYVMSYNGEIYNFQFLKIKLESKYGTINWKSTSDSEVILEGFAREGYHFLSKLNGIFVISIYDQNEKTIHVVRDPIGIKPLYFTEQNGAVFFCSELKGLLSIPSLKRTIRKESLSEQLAFMYVPEPFTMFEEFTKVKPGVYYSYKEGKLQKSESIYDFLQSKQNDSSELEITNRLYKTLTQSVKRQVIADVPISLFLSGGLDSSSIAHAAVTAGANIKTAYTISFSKEDRKYDSQSPDILYAGKISEILNLELRVIKANPNFLHMLPDLIPYMEDGISDPAAINTYLIAKAAREDGVKVMLNGQGADEYLCGYRRYRAEYLNEKMPNAIKLVLALSKYALPSSIPGKFNAHIRRLNKLVDSFNLANEDRLPGYFMWGTNEQIKNLFLNPPKNDPGALLKDFFNNHKQFDSISAMLMADQKFDLLSLNLSYTDKLGMAVGVEARVPFLDFEMVKLMNAIPNKFKIKGGIEKYILKKAMEPYLPHEVIYRQKAGFALPIRSWFRQSSPMMEKYFNESRIKKQGIFDWNKINEILKLQFENKSDNSYLIFSMLCQQIWLEQQLGF